MPYTKKTPKQKFNLNAVETKSAIEIATISLAGLFTLLAFLVSLWLRLTDIVTQLYFTTKIDSSTSDVPPEYFFLAILTFHHMRLWLGVNFVLLDSSYVAKRSLDVRTKLGDKSWQNEIRVRFFLLLTIPVVIFLGTKNSVLEWLMALLFLQSIVMLWYTKVIWHTLFTEAESKWNYLIVFMDWLTFFVFCYFSFLMLTGHTLGVGEVNRFYYSIVFYMCGGVFVAFAILEALAVYRESIVRMLSMFWYAFSPGIVPWAEHVTIDKIDER